MTPGIAPGCWAKWHPSRLPLPASPSSAQLSPWFVPSNIPWTLTVSPRYHPYITKGAPPFELASVEMLRHRVQMTESIFCDSVFHKAGRVRGYLGLGHIVVETKAGILRPQFAKQQAQSASRRNAKAFVCTRSVVPRSYMVQKSSL